MPASGPVTGHPVRLHARRDGTGPAEPHPPRLRNPDLGGIAAESPHLLWSDGNDSEPLIPSGLAPGRPPGRIRAVQERGYRMGEVPQRLLLHHLGARLQPVLFRAGGCELTTLLQVTWCALPTRMPVRMLLDSEVPHIPGMRAVVQQHRLLSGHRSQPVSRHANTLASTADISGEVKRRCLPRLKAGDSTPRIG